MFVSTLLMILTWLIVCLGATGIGLAGIRLLASKRQGWTGLTAFRIALWWGLVAIVAGTLAWNLVLPLKGLSVQLFFLALSVISIYGWLAARPRGVQLYWSTPKFVVLAAIVIAGIASSFLALGIPINYDTGLYHLGAILYAQDFATVPGLANLHDRFGFNSSIFPIAALLGNGLWVDQGFRVVSGVLPIAASLDLMVRLLSKGPGTKSGPDTKALAMGLSVVWAYAILTPGSSLASPNSDIGAALLIVVASAYLLEALDGGQGSLWSGATAIVVGALAATTRPLNWLFLALLVVVVWAVAQRRHFSRSLIAGGAVASVLLILMLVRDTLLSGWLLFPLSLVPTPVDWRFPEPQSTSDAITAWGRAPHQAIEDSLTGWDWLVPWLNNTARDEIVALSALALGAFFVLLITRRVHKSRLFWAVLPSVGVLPIWFVTAPDTRFAWGQLVIVGVVPLAIAWDNWTAKDTPVLASMGFLAAALVGTAALGNFATVMKDVRPIPMGGAPWELVVGPVIESETRPSQLGDGTPVQEASGDQCWAAFPLCRPGGSPTAVESRGTMISQGFRSTDPTS